MTDWSRPPPPPELARLAPFAGEWASVDRHQPMEWMPEGGEGWSRLRLSRALDGYGFVLDFEALTPFGGIKGHGLLFYDRERGLYRSLWYDNWANCILGEGGFGPDGALAMDNAYRMAGQDVRERHRWELQAADRFRQTIETFVGGRFQPTSELSYRRVG